MSLLHRRRLRAREEELRPRKADGMLPPHDVEAERAVCSGSLNDVGAAEHAAGILSPEDFFDLALARVFTAIKQIVGEHNKPDMVSVASWLRDREWSPPQGGWGAYLSDLYHGVGAHPGCVVLMPRWAKVVSLKARRRRMIATAHRIANEGYFDVGDEQEWLDASTAAISECAVAKGDTNTMSAGEAIGAAFREMTDAAERGDRLVGIPTGYERIDARMGGMRDGELIIVASRPGMGKTSFVMNIATRVAAPRTVELKGKHQSAPRLGVCVFSLEMPTTQLAQRMVCADAEVDLGRTRQNMLEPDDWRKLTGAASELSDYPIWIDDTAALGLLDLRARVRRRQAEYNRDASDKDPGRRVGLVAIDYLQLMTGDGESREQEIAYISRGLKAMAKELRVPVIALSQLNRDVEKRGKNKRPQLSDLRESGAVEQDADAVLFLYRDEYYNPETTDAKGLAEVIIAKQRNGPTGRVFVRFRASCTRFYNLEPGDYPEANDAD